MRVLKVMTKSAGACAPSDTLATAASVMWKHDCGFVPVVADSKVVGVITDRDIAIALGSRARTAAEILVGDVATRKPVTCFAEDKVESAIAKMKNHRVRRLPVVDAEGSLLGVLSVADLLHASGKKKSLRKKVFSALRDISAPCPIVLSETH